MQMCKYFMWKESFANSIDLPPKFLYILRLKVNKTFVVNSIDFSGHFAS